MLGRFFAAIKARTMSEAAKASIRIIYTNAEVLGLGIKDDLPVRYARDPRFLGAVCGLVDFTRVQYGEPIKSGEVLNQVLDFLFHSETQTADTTIQASLEGSVFDDALEEVQQYLTWMTSQPKPTSDDAIKRQFMFLQKYF